MPHARTGFTLVELMVVALLIALAVGVATPSLRPRRARSARASAEAVALLCETTRGLAARRGEVVVLALDVRSASYVIAASAPDGSLDTLSRGVLPRAGLGAPASDSDAGTVVRFAPTGAARGGPLAIDGEGGRFEVVISPWTGRASVRNR
jgi:type II secretion system protein H